MTRQSGAAASGSDEYDAFIGLGWSALLIAVVWWSTVLMPGPGDVVRLTPLSPLAIGLLSISSAALLIRRRWPFLTLAIAAAVDTMSIVLKSTDGIGYHYAALFGVFFVAARYRLSQTCVLVAGSMGVVYLGAAANSDWRWMGFGPVGAIITTLLAAAFGQVRYLREQLLLSLRERVDSVEETREAVARTRVAEDRLRTARELHDVVGHRIAVVHLRASAALRSLDSDTTSVRRALHDIDDASRAVLRDIDQLLAELRAGDSGPAESDLRQLESLVEEFHRYGLDVRTEVEGDVAAVPVTASRVAYQSVLEALTNALKHGDADRAVSLAVREESGVVSVRVANAARAATCDPAREGWGLSGMRERVTSVAGAVKVTQGEEFVVEISVPTGAAR